MPCYAMSYPYHVSDLTGYPLAINLVCRYMETANSGNELVHALTGKADGAVFVR